MTASPIFYFVVAVKHRPRDVLVATLVDQCHLLAPAGSSANRLLQRTLGVSVVVDSWVFPPGNPVRSSLVSYAHLIAGWYARTRYAAARAIQ